MPVVRSHICAIEYLAAIMSPRVRISVTLFLIAATALAVLYMILYWRGVIPFDGMI